MAAGAENLAAIAQRQLPQIAKAERRAALEALQRVIDAEFFKLAAGEGGNVDVERQILLTSKLRAK